MGGATGTIGALTAGALFPALFDAITVQVIA
jgi:hypothetical protein